LRHQEIKKKEIMSVINLTNYPERSVAQLLKGNKEFNILINTCDSWRDVEKGLDKIDKITPEQSALIKKKYWAF